MRMSLNDEDFNEWRLSRQPYYRSQCGLFNLVKELVKAEKLKKASLIDDVIHKEEEPSFINADDDETPKTPPYPEEDEYILATKVIEAEIVKANEDESLDLPLKKRKLLESSTTKKKKIRKRRKKTQYYIDFEKNVLYPRYRVTLYDKFIVDKEGERPNSIVILKSWFIDCTEGCILWNVRSSYYDNHDFNEEEWTEKEDHLLLL